MKFVWMIARDRARGSFIGRSQRVRCRDLVTSPRCAVSLVLEDQVFTIYRNGAGDEFTLEVFRWDESTSFALYEGERW